jgi:16S rRNA (guanine527-N7)-methyltransferase
MTKGLDSAGLGNVSRETLQRLEHFRRLLEKWNRAINLISRAGTANVWHRHIEDSLQLFQIAAPSGGHWADLGSGGGLPGLVVAIVAIDHAPDLRVTLVESDQRKAAFLQAVIRETGCHATVLAERIESIKPLNANYLSARALAPLTTLLGYAQRHLAPGGTAILPKGATYQAEVDAALEHWRFSLKKHTSKTESEAVILTIRGISRV